MATNDCSRVAIIGAGISGVSTAAHLLKRGIRVTVFERNAEAGGVWVYDERVPPEPYYPAILPSKGEQYRVDFKESGFPGPCHPGLRNNVPTRLMKTTLADWPEGTDDIVSHDVMKRYIQDVARKGEAEAHIRYKTAVLKVDKSAVGWKVLSTRHRRDSFREDDGATLLEEFDAVVVATGHYHAPRMPDLPGLSELKALCPKRVTHSKGYRGPQPYAGKNVLVIGTGASALDVAREVATVANEVFHSCRGGAFDVPLKMFPEGLKHMSEVQRIDLGSGGTASPKANDSFSAKFRLSDGRVLCGIDHVIMCTGYHITLPFLDNFHRDDVSPLEADEKIIVTDGRMYHNLHKDIFYIPDPTLVFVGVPYYTATFSLFEFQAQALAAVLAGSVKLPTENEMREEYNERVKKKGLGKSFHSLRGVEVEYVDELLQWTNPQLEAAGEVSIARHTAAWMAAKDEMTEKTKTLFAGNEKIQGESKEANWDKKC